MTLYRKFIHYFESVDVYIRQGDPFCWIPNGMLVQSAMCSHYWRLWRRTVDGLRDEPSYDLLGSRQEMLYKGRVLHKNFFFFIPTYRMNIHISIEKSIYSIEKYSQNLILIEYVCMFSIMLMLLLSKIKKTKKY